MARAPTGCSTGLPVENCIVRALAEMDQTTHVVRSISYSSSRARSSYPDELELPLRRAGGASRHSVLAIRARKRALSARLGDSFYFARCEIVESLLRRGARYRSALGTGHSDEKTRNSNPPHQSILRTAKKASCGTSTRPTCRIRFLPAFCFSSSLRLREISPP